jgi:hypothetical protein
MKISVGGIRWGCSYIATHHDHAGERTGVERFERTDICGDCNVSEGRAKHRLHLPDDFSFSPEEMALFLCCAPHQRPVIDYAAAKAVYLRVIYRLQFYQVPSVAFSLLADRLHWQHRQQIRDLAHALREQRQLAQPFTPEDDTP